MRTPFSLSLLFLASLGLVGCGGDDASTTDSGSTSTATTDSGLTSTDTSLLDRDDDGYTGADGDCDDGNGAINPEATDVVGDGIDQNCDGIDGFDAEPSPSPSKPSIPSQFWSMPSPTTSVASGLMAPLPSSQSPSAPV